MTSCYGTLEIVGTITITMHWFLLQLHGQLQCGIVDIDYP